jgi:DNA-directed RNA polymerase specialized sigma24 family protein
VSEERRLEWADFDEKAIARAHNAIRRFTRLRDYDVEDVVHDALADLMRRRPVSRSPVGLLITTALFNVRDASNKAGWRPRSVSLPDSDVIASACTEPGAALAEREEAQRRASALLEAFGRLSAADRNRLLEHYFSDKPASVNSDAGSGSSTERCRLHRTRRRLKVQLERAGDGVDWKGSLAEAAMHAESPGDWRGRVADAAEEGAARDLER